MAELGKSRGQNFSSAELKQLCCSWMHISQDPIVGGGQQNLTFWDRVGKHYNQNRPHGTQERGARSLESKWSKVKHDVAKFAGSYSSVVDAHHSGTNEDDTIQKAKELYQMKHVKQKEFMYLDQWHLLKDCPRFAMTVEDLNTKAVKGRKKGKGKDDIEKENHSPNPNFRDEGIQEPMWQSMPSSGEIDEGSTHGSEHRPIGNKSAKKMRSNECSMKIATDAQREMVNINAKRLKLLEKQDRQSLFSLKVDDLDEECREYFRAYRALELKAAMRQIRMAEARAEDEERVASRIASQSPLPIPTGNLPNPVSPVIECDIPPETPVGYGDFGSSFE